MVKTYTHEFNTKVYKGSVSFKTGLFINGEWVDPVNGGDIIDVVNPTTGRVITSISGGGERDIDIAVKAARSALKTTWGLIRPGAERGKILGRLADLLEKYADTLAALESLNIGKPYSVSRNFDIPVAISLTRYFAGWADKIHGKTIETNEKKLIYTRHEPMGVVGAITPWNVPLLTIMMKISAALATGNTLVLKPSEIAPFIPLYLADLLNEADVPPGVVNIVPGYGHTAGSAISLHRNIDKITFTGSTLTSRKILRAAAESNLKPVTLELGGKNPTIIFDDVDVEYAISWAAQGAFVNMGQICIAGSRIYVHEAIYDKFLEGLTKWTEEITSTTGNPFEEGTQHGPQISETQYDRIMYYINSGISEGAVVHAGGERIGEEGYFIRPTIFVDVKPSMKIMQEEIFGPVCCVVKFSTEEEVIEWANDTTYGLAANVFTQNSGRAIRMAHALEAGTINVNCSLSLESNVPFGGYKQSGLGRELGKEALDGYTQVKAVHVNLGQVL